MANQYTKMVGLTARQKMTFDFIRDQIQETGICPSYQEIGEVIGCVKSGVSRIIDSLVEKGYIERLPGKIRALAVVQHCCPHCGGDINSKTVQEKCL